MTRPMRAAVRRRAMPSMATAALSLAPQGSAAREEAPGAAPFDLVRLRLAPASQQSAAHGAAATRVQPKMEVGPADDPYEREADDIADAVMRTPADTVAATVANTGVRRKCAACEKEDKVRRQTVAEAEAAMGPPSLAAPSNTLISGGMPLAAGTRAFYEPRLSRSLSGVRLHQGASAQALNDSINARAFTYGSHIWLGGGASDRPSHTLSHEIAHVLQQTQPPSLATDGDHQGPGTKPASAAVDTAPARLALQRQEAPEPATPAEDEEAPTLTREEEVKRSLTSPGVVTAQNAPFRLILSNFGIDRYGLKAEHKAAMAELRDLIASAKSGHLRLVIVGHTDASGTERNNQKLSSQRAVAVLNNLGRTAGAQVVLQGLGERQPMTDNDTHEGRDQNRRVEIYFQPGSAVRRPEPVEPTPASTTDDTKGSKPATERRVPSDAPAPADQATEEPQSPGSSSDKPAPTDEPSTPDDSGWCDKYPIICAALTGIGIVGVGIGVGIGLGVGIGGGGAGGIGVGVGVVKCLTDPAACLPDIPSPPGPKDPDPYEPDEPPMDHACEAGRNLPSGTIKAKHDVVGNRHLLKSDFSMAVSFRDAPDEGCVCSCGEYLQEVHGSFTQNNGPDWKTNPSWQRLPGPLTATGRRIHATNWQEDADYPRPYGHRFEDPLRTLPADPLVADQFLPDQATGCDYSGSDSPGFNMVSPSPGEYAFKLNFRGAPVDGCLGRTRIGDWSEWEATGYLKIDPPTPGPVPPPAPTATPAAKPLLCLDDHLGCATLEYIRTFRVTQKDEANFDTAVGIEVAALAALCPPPSGADATQWENETLRNHALGRVQAFLWGGNDVTKFPAQPCP